jgi:hypothetical protein
MNFFSLGYLFLLLGAGVTFAAEPVTVELVHFAAGKPLPEELAKNTIAAHGIKPGCELTFLVQGSNLAALIPESLKIHVLTTKAGKDVRKFNGKPSYQELSSFAKETHGGRYGKFTLELDASLFADLSALEIQGSIQVQVADGQEKLESKSFATTEQIEFKLGDFQIKSLGEKPESQSFFQAAPSTEEDTAEDAAKGKEQTSGSTIIPVEPQNASASKGGLLRPGPTPEELAKLPKNYWVQLLGPTERVAQFRVLRQGNPLSSRSWSGGEKESEYEFVLDERRNNSGGLEQLFGVPATKPAKKPDPAGDELLKKPIKVELTTWKNLRTVTVPFQHNAPKK